MTFLMENKSVVIWLKTCQLHSGAAELLSAALNSVQQKVRPLEVEDLDKVSQGYRVQSDVRRKTQLDENTLA